MHTQVIIAGLLVLLTGAVVSYPQVRGVVGQSVTLPCTYPVINGDIHTMCWGRAGCPQSGCMHEIIRTNGVHAIFQRHERYQLKGKIPEGNVSLTIQDANQIDTGLYCCRVEYRGWFNDRKLTLSLEIRPASVTNVPTSPKVSTSAPPTPALTQSYKPASVTNVPTSPKVSTSAPPTPALTQSYKPVATSPFPKQSATTHFQITQETRMQPTSSPGHQDTSATSPFPKQPATTHFQITQETRRTQPTSSPGRCDTSDGNGTVTQSTDGLWHGNQTGVSLVQEPGMTTANGVYIGIGIFALVLLSVLAVMIIKRHLYIRNKLQQLRVVSFNGSHIGALQRAAENRVKAEDNIYIVEDNLYVMD
ncbi:hepatitis A virus cellular receptor 1 homolog isoform X1 [Choloepus didactylus]|uniref:hepatitis A virus cellular receptor 1 homolog isoform X1 n=1 Tax=Choloepus didactylus TaxID=27675 RepID=UPI00189D4CEF|nr:hepatitis A virus cellular receptor 1 homolog isoform X1 [Choloepus didactylus]